MLVDDLSDDQWRQRDQVELHRLLRAQRPYRRAVVSARAAQRSDPDVHQCRHGAVQERLHRHREAPLCAGGHGAEMRARRRQAQRPRQCRLYGAPPHLLRDAREFLVRRLLQGPRHRARLNLVTKEFDLAKDRLWVTVHPSDDSARRLWKKIAGLPDERIVGHPDNIWAMGPLGPCGYCSEIFYDQGESVVGGPPGSPEEDGDRFLEFWNLVFMQFEQVDEKTRIELPRPSIDTGMGLERITAILQGVTNNYEIDLFHALIREVANLTG